jgi:hypothetical protein
MNVVGMAVEVLAGSVVAHRGPGIGVADRDLHVAQVNCGVETGGDVRYLYLIFKRTWSGAVSESEAREPPKAKERSEEKRPWSWPCRTWLTEPRISVMHDPTNPGFLRVSGGEGQITKMCRSICG